MNTKRGCPGSLLVVCASLFSLVTSWAETFRVASYNLESYLDYPTETRPAKTSVSKTAVRETIKALKPDIIALQEVGTQAVLLELRDSLKNEGLDLPHWELVTGFDTNVHVAVLSRFPFTARHPHTNESYLLAGRRFRVSRGFAELDIQINDHYAFTLIAAHLKSKRTVAMGDETEMRAEEARLLREKIDARLAANPAVNLAVLGDFNDTKDAASTKTVIGRGSKKLIDTCPAEQFGRADTGSALTDNAEARAITWTHYYAKNDTYSRIDFLLLSRGMAREWKTNETFVLSLPQWGKASDHRPIVATFDAEER
jgi:endonuclease/exonuclease/phosphatase family metal-dependent hydrolase